MATPRVCSPPPSPLRRPLPGPSEGLYGLGAGECGNPSGLPVSLDLPVRGRCERQQRLEVVQNAFTFMVFVSGGGGLGCDMVGYALAKGM